MVVTDTATAPRTGLLLHGPHPRGRPTERDDTADDVALLAVRCAPGAGPA